MSIPDPYVPDKNKYKPSTRLPGNDLPIVFLIVVAVVGLATVIALVAADNTLRSSPAVVPKEAEERQPLQIAVTVVVQPIRASELVTPVSGVPICEEMGRATATTWCKWREPTPTPFAIVWCATPQPGNHCLKGGN